MQATIDFREFYNLFQRMLTFIYSLLCTHASKFAKKQWTLLFAGLCHRDTKGFAQLANKRMSTRSGPSAARGEGSRSMSWVMQQGSPDLATLERQMPQQAALWCFPTFPTSTAAPPVLDFLQSKHFSSDSPEKKQSLAYYDVFFLLSDCVFCVDCPLCHFFSSLTYIIVICLFLLSELITSNLGKSFHVFSY